MTEQTEQEPIDPIAQCIRWLSFMVVNQEDRRMVQAELESIAAQVRERDAQIARLTEQVERQTTALRSIAQWCPPSAPGTEWQGSGNYDDAYNAGSDDAYWALGQIAIAALTAPQEV